MKDIVCVPFGHIVPRTVWLFEIHLTCYLCPGTIRVVGAPLLTSNVLPSISFRENAFGVWGWIDSTVNTTSHNLCGSCDLASKLNDVTGDELDIDVSIALFRNQTILRWCRCLCGLWLFFICPHTDLVTVLPTESEPIHKLYISARGHYCGKKFQHILGLCSSCKQRKLENK